MCVIGFVDRDRQSSHGTQKTHKFHLLHGFIISKAMTKCHTFQTWPLANSTICFLEKYCYINMAIAVILLQQVFKD